MGGAPPPPLGFAPQGVSREHFFGGSAGPPAVRRTASRESPEDRPGRGGGAPHTNRSYKLERQRVRDGQVTSKERTAE